MYSLQDDLQALLPPERVLTSPVERVAFASDASFYRLVPQAVVQPNSIEEIQKLFAYCRRNQLPLTLRAAGTSLSGQSITDGVLVDLSRRWNRIEIEQDGASVRLQPGVIGAHANRILQPLGRRIGPDPASIDACMIGGIIANNASGMCCGVEENSYRTLQSLTFVLPDGLACDSSEPDSRAEFARLRPALAEGLSDLRRRILADEVLADRIQRKYRTKNTTGYSLNAFLDFADPLDIFSHLLIGSEGTLGFLANASLRTLPIYPHRLTGLLYFWDVQAGGRAIVPLRHAGARALEIMDRASLRAIEDQPGMPLRLKDLPPDAAGLLVEFQEVDAGRLNKRLDTANRVCEALDLLEPPSFTSDAEEQAALWKVRKGLFPAIGAMRKPGTTVLIEDVAFPVERLADAISDLQILFHRHDYPDGIIYGHAKDGNLHFTVTQGFSDSAETARYERFIDDLVKLVVDKYDGALKAEHGTGRNMAPFVETEWGTPALQIMQELKRLVDPEGFLNPGVILNPDPLAHLHDLKDLPVAAAEIDSCIECGFCESGCPSRRLTLTPRQRIVVLREMQRLEAAGAQPELLAGLQADYRYAVLDTCAVDGLCATACPVGINTGELVKHQRADGTSARGLAIAGWLSEHFNTTETAIGLGVHLGHAVGSILPAAWLSAPSLLLEKPLKRRLPKWNAAVPHPSPALPRTQRNGAAAVYFPACLSRQMGRPPFDGKSTSLAETLVLVAKRAGQPLWIPPDTHGLCCGMPFSSKGYPEAFRAMLRRTIHKFWEWTNGGEIPVVIDASSCAYTLLTCQDSLEPGDRVLWEKIRLLDSVEFACKDLLPNLEIHPLEEKVVLHPNCALRKMEGVGSLLQIARACAFVVDIPQHLECCAYAGDRGLLFPELTASATELEAAEVLASEYDGYYSSNLTCEMGMALATGKSYRSILYLLERASR